MAALRHTLVAASGLIASLLLLASPARAAGPHDDGQYSPLIVPQTMSYETANAETRMSEWAPEAPLGVFACTPPIPSSVDMKTCCLGTKAAPINADSLGTYFCYCAPQKIISVCGEVGSQGGGATIKEHAEWCQFSNLHPLFGGKRKSCN